MTAVPAGPKPRLGSLVRIGLTYGWCHNRLPALSTPTRFTEFVQRRKLYDRDPRLPTYADKVAVKALVAARLGSEWVTPTLWHGEALPDTARWPEPFVVKSRHGCRQIAFMRGAGDDWADIVRQSQGWMRRDYGRWLDEWLYTCIPRGLLVEPYLGRGRCAAGRL